jgi:hypothetical protein
MPFLEAITFTLPWALAGLAALPLIWWLLRFTPPRPQAVKFPPLRLLLELVSKQDQPDKTPWWLLLLRLAIAALVIFAVSHPLYAPGRSPVLDARPLLIVVDDGWAAARDWTARARILRELLDSAARNGAPAALATTAPAARMGAVELAAAPDIARRASALAPRALAPDRPALLERLRATFANADGLRVAWLADGLDYGDSRGFAEGLAGLAAGRASVDVFLPDRATIPGALAVPVIDGGRIKVTALRVPGPAAEQLVRAHAANGRTLAEARLTFASDAGRAEAALELPLELRNEASRIAIADGGTAGGVFLFDDRWRRKTVALLAGSGLEQAQPLLSPLYYVSRAVEPYAEIFRPVDVRDLKEQLEAGLSMLVLADIGVLPGEEREAVTKWVEAGGMLLRFAGPRLAGGQDDLVPVTLREGGRSLGSALSWETPQAMQTFPEQSPFAGLALDPTVRITRQVLAEPDAGLQERVWASLEDGTPLVTATQRGKGAIVLFHVTANADWSNLPLTGLFVEMLRRILDIAPGAGGSPAPGATAEQSSAAWTPLRVLNGAGDLVDPPPEAGPIPARDMDQAVAGAARPAGIYSRGGAQRALNIITTGDALVPITGLPPGIATRSFADVPELPLAPWLFAAAFALFLLDCIAALVLSGAWRRLRPSGAAAALALALFTLAPASDLRAQEPDLDFGLRSTLATHLAYVLTDDAAVDDVSGKGLQGLGNILVARTSVEPGDPVGIDIERDEIVFFPLLYWPVLPDAQPPSPAALAKIDAYMKNGGTIFFDTREDGTSFDALSGNTSPALLALRGILEKLDIPALEPVPPEHVLTKSFYLLQSFPGRYDLGQLWVESTDTEGTAAGNADGVSSILIGSNDYAAAWAQDPSGEPLFAVMPGGERQREYAYRAGINIVMYALTGNYKADQVHVPSLLERLGQ